MGAGLRADRPVWLNAARKGDWIDEITGAASDDLVLYRCGLGSAGAGIGLGAVSVACTVATQIG